jgi:hypothetical protein
LYMPCTRRGIFSEMDLVDREQQSLHEFVCNHREPMYVRMSLRRATANLQSRQNTDSQMS